MSETATLETDLLALDQPYGEEGDTARAAAAEHALETLSDVLEEPEYTGDIQTALIHHMRRDAFDWYLSGNVVPHYVELEEKIVQNASETKGLVPVVITYQIENGGGTVREGRSNYETALVAVDPSQPHFRSTVEHVRDVERRGYTDKLAITTRTLALVGRTARLPGLNLADSFLGVGRGEDPQQHYYPDREQALTLHQTKLVSGLNSVKPPEDITIEGAETEIERFYGSDGAAILVGWQQIAAAVTQNIRAVRDNTPSHHGDGPALKYLSGLVEFFEAGDQTKAFFANSGQDLKNVFRAASRFEETLGSLAVNDIPY